MLMRQILAALARPTAIDARSQVIYELQDAQGLPTGGAAARGVATGQGLDGYAVERAC